MAMHRHTGPGDLPAVWEAAWRDRTGDDTPWPLAGAEVVVHALAPVAAGGPDGAATALDDAARRWAETGLPVDGLIGRLGVLREVLVERVPDRAAAVQRAVDRLTTVTTEAVLAVVQDAARTDPLTGVGNRRAMVEAARPAVAAAVRSGNPLAVVAIDVDGLKTLNDTVGHAAGDRALADVARALRDALRGSDQLFRVGGDEFVAVLPLVGPADVAEIMDRAGAAGPPRFSWGMARVPEDGATLEAALSEADSRLYGARRHRRTGRPARTTPPVAGTAGTSPSGLPGGQRARRGRRRARRRPPGAAGADPGGHGARRHDHRRHDHRRHDHPVP